MELRGAVVVVTGASAGIGLATVRSLARRGAAVVLAARRKDLLDEEVERLRGRGGRAIAVQCDVVLVEDVERLRQEAEQAFGSVDVLINNAGIPGGGEFAKQSLEKIDRIVKINLLSVLTGTRVFLPGMLERGRGHVVNVASLAGRYAAPGAAVYAATKHAVVAFSESLHHEVEGRGVLVTTVNPAFVATEGFPQRDKPSWMVMQPERIGQVIADVIRRGVAPEISVPRWTGSLQAFRVLTPPLFRWGVRRVTSRMRPTRAGS